MKSSVMFSAGKEDIHRSHFINLVIVAHDIAVGFQFT